VISINSLGTLCPQPIIDLSRAVAANPDDSAFELLSDDPATWPDLQAWGRMTHRKVSQLDATKFLIQTTQ
jgi:cysteine desulfurase